jgi:hypothetical protein
MHLPSLAQRVLLIVAVSASAAFGQEWSSPVRGSWVRDGGPQAGDVDLTHCEIVVGDKEASPVRQAATFLSGDVDKLVGVKPPIVAKPSGDRVAIHVLTQENGALPAGIRSDDLKGKWEAYQVVTSADGKSVSLVGSDARGTAFAAYTLSERLGIDPLHHWTGHEPQRRDRLVLKKTEHFDAGPTFKYRGMFHDDEDILPRPFEYSGYPLRIGDVPTEWYAKFFETALRLRMNMVAPYTRVHRRYEVQKMASDWGLFYTSHHYDILLSNPFGMTRFKLAERRGVSGAWDWLNNRENMLRYWRGGVEENKDLDCIWPVGLRGTDDYAYKFPRDLPQAEQNKIFRDVIDAQIGLARELTPKDRPSAFHFTLYGEMLDKFLATGGIEVPEDVILIWPDDNDGRIRSVPKDRGKWKHGVYYHAAYYGPATKQNAHFVHPTRVADEFRRITDAGATEYMLLNVSELREFVMEARMIAEICWDAKTALHDTPPKPSRELLPHVPTEAKTPLPPDEPSPSAERFVRWWATEYFGPDAAHDVVASYQRYFELFDRWDRQWQGSDKVAGALASLSKKFASQSFEPARPETLPALRERDAKYAAAFKEFEAAKAKMSDYAQRQFFFEHVELPLLFDWRPTQAAIPLVEAMAEPDNTKAWAKCEAAMAPLEQLEVEILRGEHPPFENWYRKTWIRHEETGLNVHRPYEQLRLFLNSRGSKRLTRPDPKADVTRFVPLLQGGNER